MTGKTRSKTKGAKGAKGAKKALPRMQVYRLARIASLLKKNGCPTAEKLLLEYEKLEFEEGKTIRARYSLRTVYRDIDVLRHEFGCPIEFDRIRKVYYLTDHNWEFNCPAQLSESAMLALIVGARIAEDVFPDPIRARITRAVDEILKGNNPDFLETTLIHSLKVFAESGAVETSPVFSIVFEAWQKHRRLKIRYDDMSGGEPTERIVDPHVLFLYQREWRIKAFCHLRQAPRTFVINRIRNAFLMPETFAPDQAIIDSVSLDTIVSMPPIHDVKIRLTGDAPKFARSNRMHTRQSIAKDHAAPGAFLFTIPSVPLAVIVPWILAQRGDAVPLSPPELVDAVRHDAAIIAKKLSPSKRAREKTPKKQKRPSR